MSKRADLHDWDKLWFFFSSPFKSQSTQEAVYSLQTKKQAAKPKTSVLLRTQEPWLWFLFYYPENCNTS